MKIQLTTENPIEATHSEKTDHEFGTTELTPD